MAEVSGFKHISVSTDSDDDVVICAGADAGAEGASSEVPDSAQLIKPTSSEVRDSVQFIKSASSEVPDSVQINQGALGDRCDSVKLDEVPDSAKSASAPTPVKRTAQSGVKDQGYRETTLDDLKSEPMSKTQKIIIACAIAAVAAAVVYYFVFMR